jgi:hypothetical protein
MFKRWTSLGVVALAVLSLELIFILLIICGQNDWIPVSFSMERAIGLGFLYMASMFISSVMAIIALIAGTADEKSQRDARMGLAVLAVNGLQVGGFVLWLFMAALRTLFH